MAELDGVRVLVVTSNTGVEHDELLVPRDELRERGARVTHAAPKSEAVQTFRHDVDKDEVVSPDAALDAVDTDDFDVLVVPGGTVNADKLRADDRAVALAKEFAGAGKPVAAICHGPWLLVEADLLRGKTLTSYHSLRTDVDNAGGAWVDEPVVRSPENGWTLITSRAPGDLSDFVGAISTELRA
ncbi:type 1 glutamine amidotransferase domain-containing protein [Nocardia amikacinitolerans]|uniref:type 1 glutamine amidotransferase domain-containing protein n=1 Tax=Nocardia amikacinitolerans TaxID=756689 RepID=UPI0020A32498|nr:type 1 glutamine amidotransferase domain-containing protein [Nocardia amikacinitolerans]MCP2287229.1 protease I [Nocardia amikacinitolerans]